MNKLVIRNPDDYVAALKQAQALADRPERQDELARLRAAIKLYDDSIAMLRGVGRKAADEPETGVANLSGAE